MNTHKELMEKVVVNSYKDCALYIKEIDKCRIPVCNKPHSECMCKESEMDEFCVWITKFMKSSPDLQELDFVLSDQGFELPPIEDEYENSWLNKLRRFIGNVLY